VTPCSLIAACEYFKGLFCLHIQVQNKRGDRMFSVYRHTARTVVRSALGVEGRGNPVSTSSRCEQTLWEQQRSNWILHPNRIYPEDGRSIFIRTVGVHSVSTMNAVLSGRDIPQTSLCFIVIYRTNCIFSFTNVPFPAGHYTVRSASTRAVPGFASRRAAQVSAVTTLCFLWSRPHGGSGRGALSEESTAKHWNPSR